MADSHVVLLGRQQHINRAQPQGSRALQVHKHLLATRVHALTSVRTRPEVLDGGHLTRIAGNLVASITAGQQHSQSCIIGGQASAQVPANTGTSSLRQSAARTQSTGGGDVKRLQHLTSPHQRAHCYMPLPRDYKSTEGPFASDRGRGVQLGEACLQSAYSALAPTSNDIRDAYSCRMARGVFLEVAGLVRKPSSSCFVRGRLVAINLSESTTCRAGRADLRACYSLQGGIVSSCDLQRTSSACNKRHCSWTVPAGLEGRLHPLAAGMRSTCKWTQANGHLELVQSRPAFVALNASGHCGV